MSYRHLYSVEGEPDFTLTPVKKLHAAMLELAVRDLTNGSRNEISDALAWFRAEETRENYNKCISFETVCDTLGVGAVVRRNIMKTLQTGRIRHQKAVEERLKGNKRGQFLQLDEHTKVTKNGNIVRKFRRNDGLTSR
jgi:hypothetical protein